MSPQLSAQIYEVLFSLGLGVCLVLLGTGKMRRYPHDQMRNDRMVKRWGKVFVILGALFLIVAFKSVLALFQGVSNPG